jgi:hypothetical protein
MWVVELRVEILAEFSSQLVFAVAAIFGDGTYYEI